jgi:outer membrane protein assembly factor BamB
VRAIPTTICWAFGVWIVAAQSPVGPPATKHPPIPVSAGNIVPVTVPLAYKPKWNLALPEATSVKVAAGTDEFFVGTDRGTLMAYSLADMQQVWTAAIVAEWLTAGDGLVFVADGRGVRALDQTTGNERWSISTGPLNHPAKWLPGWLLTQAADGTVAAWRIGDGSKIWEQKLSAPASSPAAVDGDRLFVPLLDRRLVCLNLEKGVIQWTIELDGRPSDPTAAAGRVYFGTDNYTFYSVKQDTGKLEWPPHRMLKTQTTGRPLLDERYIWITTLNNKVHALSRTNGQIELTMALVARPKPQFILDSGQVIVPLTSGHLLVFSQKDGQRMPSPTATPPPPTAAELAAAAALPPPAAGVLPPPPPLLPPNVTIAVPAPPPAGTTLAAPLILAGFPDAPVILRTTLDSGSGHIVTSFEREKPPPPPAPVLPPAPAP